MYTMEQFVAEENIKLIRGHLQKGHMDKQQANYMKTLLARAKAELKDYELRRPAAVRWIL
jgi:hypothetical protein